MSAIAEVALTDLLSVDDSTAAALLYVPWLDVSETDASDKNAATASRAKPAASNLSVRANASRSRAIRSFLQTSMLPSPIPSSLHAASKARVRASWCSRAYANSSILDSPRAPCLVRRASLAGGHCTEHRHDHIVAGDIATHMGLRSSFSDPDCDQRERPSRPQLERNTKPRALFAVHGDWSGALLPPSLALKHRPYASVPRGDAGREKILARDDRAFDSANGGDGTLPRHLRFFCTLPRLRGGTIRRNV